MNDDVLHTWLCRVEALEAEVEELSSRPDWTAYNALQDERDHLREAMRHVWDTEWNSPEEVRRFARQVLERTER